MAMAKLSRLRLPDDFVDLGDGRHVRLAQRLGQGSNATVYRGVLESRHALERMVAVKLFAALASDDADQGEELFASAARRWAAVRHPNVVAVYDFTMHGAHPVLVTELVEGTTLESLLQLYADAKRRLPLDLALFIAVETAEALSAARTARDARGAPLEVLHLGLSPRDILLSRRGEVKVGDFELANAHAATSKVRSLRTIAHRAKMLAPEVARGAAGDARSDVFTVGVLLRELFVGPRFPKSVTPAEAVDLAREGFVQSMCFKPHLPSSLEVIIERALDVDPGDRFPNATALAYELRRAALAMGVADGRYFLRQHLERQRSEETTAGAGQEVFDACVDDENDLGDE